MSHEQIVAVFDSSADAHAAVSQLEASGIASTDIRQDTQETRTAAGTTAGQPQEQSFWSMLFGTDTAEHDTTVYDRSLESGGFVVAVRCEQSVSDNVMSILERNNAVDIDERAASYGLSRSETSADSDGALRLSEEQLEVGKRRVDQGSTRLRRYVVETPVEEQVEVRDETVRVERRPVSGGASVGTDAFTDKSIEMTEVDEEIVVGKKAHVVEEVSLRKDVESRTETVKDTVRREEVEVEKVDGNGTGAVRGDDKR